MPTKRTRRNRHLLGRWRLSQIHALLLGRCLDAADAARLRAEGVEYDCFDEFDWTEDQRRALIAEHRVELLAEAQRHGITPTWLSRD